MSGIGLDFNRVVPQIDTGVSSAKIGASVGARTNSALQLAQSLAEVNPKITAVAGAVAKEDQDVQSTAAKKRALELGGQALGDAVRAGKIEPTQNPFFIEEYNKQSAYVRAQTAISQMRVDSQTWPEADDPQAFQQRYTKELGEIGAKYNTDPDTQEGFTAAAAPAQEQDFSANIAQKVAQIKADRLSVSSNLVAQTIQQVQSANGGKPAPQQVWDALATQKDQFLKTGGSDQEWDKLVANGVTAAALQQSDPSMMDLLKDSKSGTSGAIYNLPGQAQDIETTKYRIIQNQQDKGRQAYYDAVQADYFATRASVNALYQKFGVAAFTGSVPVDDMVSTLTDAGTPPDAVAGALNKVQATVADYQGLSEARFKSFAATVPGQAELMDLHMQAKTQGYTPELEARVAEHVLAGDIPSTTADNIVDDAISTSRSAGPGGGRLPKAARAALRGYTSTGSAIDQAAANTAGKMNQALRIKGGTQLSSAEVSKVMETARGVANYYLRANPSDYAGATLEAQKAINDLLKPILQKHLKNVGTK